MKHKRVHLSRVLILGITLLALVSCIPSVEVGEPFTLWEGETISVRGTGLTIEAELVYFGKPGSHDPGDGAVDLRVRVGGGEETEVFLEVGQQKEVGGYVIRFEKLVSVVEKGEWKKGCELVVVQEGGE